MRTGPAVLWENYLRQWDYYCTKSESLFDYNRVFNGRENWLHLSCNLFWSRKDQAINSFIFTQDRYFHGVSKYKVKGVCALFAFEIAQFAFADV